MKRWNACSLLWLGVCCCLLAALLASGVLAQSASPYEVAGGMISGGVYRLTTVTLPSGQAMSGGQYRLLSSSRSTGTGSGCCCTYLPCILRNK
jgi:hypothetical protein